MGAAPNPNRGSRSPVWTVGTSYDILGIREIELGFACASRITLHRKMQGGAPAHNLASQIASTASRDLGGLIEASVLRELAPAVRAAGKSASRPRCS
jgi:hypothetical protein